MNNSISPTLNIVIISVYSLSVPISIIGIVGNCIVVLAYLKFPQLRKDGPKLIWELAAGDLILETCYLIATISRIIIHSSYDVNSFSKFTCITLGTLASFGLYISQLYTLFVAYDRYKVMSKPMEYFHNHGNNQHTLRNFIFVCIFSFLSTATFYVGVDLNSKSELCATASSIHKVSAIYFTMFMFTVGVGVIYYYVKAVVSLKSLKKNAASLGTQADKDRARREMRITETVTIVLIAFILLWFIPNMVTLFLAGLDKLRNIMKIPYLSVLASVNSAINVFVYAAKSSIIRPYLIATIKCKKANTVTGIH